MVSLIIYITYIVLVYVSSAVCGVSEYVNTYEY